MDQASDAGGVALFDDPVRGLAVLSEFVVNRGQLARWTRAREVVLTFGDHCSFAELSAWRSGDRMRVLLEFGAEDRGARCALGAMSAHWVWSGEGGDLAHVESVLLEGRPAGIGRFVRAAVPYLALGLNATDFVEIGEA